MSTKEKLKEVAQTISEKTREYAPVVKEKVMLAYAQSKDFTLHVIIPKTKEGLQIVKTKIDDFQAKRAAEKTPKKPH